MQFHPRSIFPYSTVAPETVKITIDPPELKPGIEATLICDSSSSNPPAKISWWRDGIAVTGKSHRFMF